MMRTALVRLFVAAPLALAALPAQAQQGADPVASAAIFNGDMTSAERDLLAELRVHPNRPELLLNLAVVYASTGRAPQARELYRAVLEQDEVLMDLPRERTAGSHKIARNGMRMISAQTTASN